MNFLGILFIKLPKRSVIRRVYRRPGFLIDFIDSFDPLKSAEPILFADFFELNYGDPQLNEKYVTP